MNCKLIIVIAFLFFVSALSAQDKSIDNNFELGLGYSRFDKVPHLMLEYQNSEKSSWTLRLHLNSEKVADMIIGSDSIPFMGIDSFQVFPKYSFLDDNYLKIALNRRFYFTKKKNIGIGFYLNVGLSTFIYLEKEPENFDRLSFPLVLNTGGGFKLPICDKLSIALEMQYERSLRKNSRQDSPIFNIDGYINFRLLYRFNGRELIG